MTAYYDFKAENGWYGVVGIGHSFELVKDKASLAVNFTTGAGDDNYNKYYFGVSGAKFEDGNVSVTLPYTLSSSWSITPGVQYTWLWDSTIKNAVGSNNLYFGKKDELVGSLAANYTF